MHTIRPTNQPNRQGWEVGVYLYQAEKGYKPDFHFVGLYPTMQKAGNVASFLNGGRAVDLATSEFSQ